MEFTLKSTSKAAESGYVYKKGLIFKAGDYPDKGFTMTPEELLAAANDFKPVSLDVEHMPSIFDGKLGELQAVEPSEDGWNLYGVAKIPVWLNELHGDAPLKVSCTWNRSDKKLTKLALVRNPRVEDAALMAAFTAHELSTASTDDEFKRGVITFMTWFKDGKNTWPGLSLFQEIHDLCSKSGAICSSEEDDDMEDKSEREGFVSQEESGVIQKLHDMTKAAGAVCSHKFHAPAQHEDETMKLKEIVAKLGDLVNAIPTNASAALSEEAAAEETVADEKVTEETAEAPTDEVVASNDAPTEEVKDEAENSQDPNPINELQKQLELAAQELAAYKAEAEKKAAELSAKLLEKEAEDFANGIIKDGKEIPANFDNVKKLYLSAANSSASFNSGESLLELLKAYFSSKEGSQVLTTEVLDSAVVLSNQGPEESEVDAAQALARAYAEKMNRKLKAASK